MDWIRLLGPFRSEHRGASGPAPARDRALADRRVIVGQFFAAADRPRCADPDRLVGDLEATVWRTGVIDEARDVAVDGGVTAPCAVDPEHPDAPLLAVPLLPRLAFLVVA